MPHLHLSLQAGDDLILKRMKRRHIARRRDRVLRAGARGCGPDIVFGADIIAGFPTETEEMFAHSLRSGRGMRPDASCTSFPIRRAPGTPAARMPQVGGRRDQERARSDCGRRARRRSRHLAAEVGATRQVLIESPTQGRTEHFAAGGDCGRGAGRGAALAIAGHDGARLTV